MNQSLVWILVAANLSLAGTLAWRGLDVSSAHAQVRPPDVGNYVLIPGTSQIGVSIIYVFDATNRRLGAIAPDGRDMITSMPTIRLDEVFEAAAPPPPAEPAGRNRGRSNAGGNR